MLKVWILIIYADSIGVQGVALDHIPMLDKTTCLSNAKFLHEHQSGIHAYCIPGIVPDHGWEDAPAGKY